YVLFGSTTSSEARGSLSRCSVFARPRAVLNETLPSSTSTQTIVECGEPSARNVVAVPTNGFSSRNFRCFSPSFAIPHLRVLFDLQRRQPSPSSPTAALLPVGTKKGLFLLSEGSEVRVGEPSPAGVRALSHQVGIKAVRRAADSLPVRGIAVLLVVVGALSALGFARHEQRIREQDQLASIASDLAGRKVTVRCLSFLAGLVDVRGEAGRVQFDDSGRPADHTDLSPETCKALRHLDRVDFGCFERGDCGLSQFSAGWAAHTLAHEAFHLRGFQDEGVTECYALQNTAYVAERLGV